MKLLLVAMVVAIGGSRAAADDARPWSSGKYKTAFSDRDISVERLRVRALYATRLYANDVRCKKLSEGEAIPRQTEGQNIDGDTTKIKLPRNLDSQDQDLRAFEAVWFTEVRANVIEADECHVGKLLKKRLSGEAADRAHVHVFNHDDKSYAIRTTENGKGVGPSRVTAKEHVAICHGACKIEVEGAGTVEPRADEHVAIRNGKATVERWVSLENETNDEVIGEVTKGGDVRDKGIGTAKDTKNTAICRTDCTVFFKQPAFGSVEVKAGDRLNVQWNDRALLLVKNGKVAERIEGKKLPSDAEDAPKPVVEATPSKQAPEAKPSKLPAPATKASAKKKTKKPSAKKASN